jgi:glycosyltransferase involved in cell wall biosynthesis
MTQMQRTTANDAGALPSCTVVVCTRGRPAQLKLCLTSIKAVAYPALTIYVVENGSRCGSEQIATEFGAKYEFLPKPGLSAARNFGARAACTDVIAFIDDDAVCDTGWLAAAAPEFSDPRVGIVTGPVLSMNTDQHLLSLGNARFTVDRTTSQWFARANFGGVGHGGNMILRQSVFASWPGFDERLGRGAPLSGGEESFAIFQLISQGWRAVYVPEGRVLHEQSSGAEARTKARQALRDSLAYFFFVYAAAPEHRRELLHYFFGGLRGVRREWRTAAASCPLTPMQRFSARLAAFPAFCRAWLWRA